MNKAFRLTWLIIMAALWCFILDGCAKDKSPGPSEDTPPAKTPLAQTETKLPAPPADKPVPKSLNPDFKKLLDLDFAECRRVKDKESLEQCTNIIVQEAYKIMMISDPALVPDLIFMATPRSIPAPPGYEMGDGIEPIIYKQGYCHVRYFSIVALGKIKDPQATDPLIEIMGQPYTPETACDFFWDDGDKSMQCNYVADALIKISPPGLAGRMMEGFKKSIPAYSKIQSQMNDMDSSSLYDVNRFLHDFELPGCYLKVLKAIGPEGTDVIAAKLRDETISEDERKLLQWGP